MSAANTSTVTDSLGRSIQIRKLSALDRMRLYEMLGGSLSENMQYMAYAMVACAVAEIDGVKEGFPSSKRAVEAMVSSLGDEGIEAVSKAYNDFNVGETGDLENIKN